MKIELLAPVGSYEALHSAIKAGADAVFFGISHLNMRFGCAKEFSFDDLKEIVEICHKSNVRAYVTLNTIVYDSEINLMKEVLNKCKENEVDAVIVADMATMKYAHSIKQEIHCSTQLSISNIEAVKFYSKFANQIVLARELSLKQIKHITTEIQQQNICAPNGKLVKIEVFAHGAMCISVSGRCFMSTFEHNLSANRGMCRQMCRRPYRVIDEETGDELRVESNYVLSPQDMCTIDFLDKILDAGVYSLKIEGRGRSPEYVFRVISAYRKALDAIEKGIYDEKLIKELFNELKSVYNRGFSKGFFFGRPIGAWSKCYGSKATTRKISVGIVTHYFAKPQVAEIKVRSNELKIGDEIYIIGKTTGTLKQKITELRNENAETVSSIKKGTIATLPVLEKVRINDEVYLIEQVTGDNEKDQKIKDWLQN